MQGTVCIIDSFTSAPFHGNPTAVCFANADTGSNEMQSIAAELNFPVTAFVFATEKKEEFRIRYFTRSTEIPACGHATLAASRAVFETALRGPVYFITVENIRIKAVWENEIVWLSYPVYSIKPYKPGNDLMKSLGLNSYLSAGICEQLETLFIELEDAKN